MEDPEEDLDRFCRERVGAPLADKWRLDRILGIGGMAAVYAATHHNGSTAALKVLHPQYAAMPGIRERFLREAYIANRGGHEGIVKVRDDAVDEHGAPFLIMELLQGSSTAERADAIGGRLPPREAVFVGVELLAILEAAHEQGIVHRDIKPDNVFWTTEGQVKVLDFGIARLREDAPSKRTRTGMVFGTPGYMAPEQALGRWSEVDARTDLWAVGATIFNLLTGQSVHEGETDNERLVNAATRPARSLGEAMPLAPTPLVTVVDRALNFDQRRRYADAKAMRAELEQAYAAMPGDKIVRPGEPAARHVGTQPEEVAAAPKEPEIAVVPELSDLLGDVSPETLTVTRELFSQLERAMKVRSQYGKDHKEWERRLEAAFAFITNAFAVDPQPIAWNIRSYGFTVGDETLWEPKPPLDRVCYRLFSDGIRALGILPGLRLDELSNLVRILIADASSDIAPEDNSLTLLWEARLDNVLYEEGDGFAEGDLQERALFEKRRLEVLAGVALDTADQLEDAWIANAGQGSHAEREARQRALLGLVAGGSAASAAAQAESMRVGSTSRDPLASAIDSATRAVWGARLATAPEDLGERFAEAAAAAFVLACRNGEPALVAAPLRSSVEALTGPTAAPDTLAFTALLEQGMARSATVDELATMSRTLVNAIVTPVRFSLLTTCVSAWDAPEVLRERYASLLGKLDGNHVATVASVASMMDPSSLRERLLGYLAEHAPGHEGEIGSTFAKGHLEPSLALLKLLTKLGTKEAKEAAQEATKSPHPIVRIEALGLVEGASGTGIRQALRAMLEDWDPAVRLAALRSIAEYRVKVAGPGLVMRIKSADFDNLPSDERRQALATLFALTGTRAEALCLDLLGSTRLVTAETHEQPRAAAAEQLGLNGRSAEAKAAHLEGTVQVKIRVLADGSTQVLGISSSLGHGLDESAMQVARGMKFQPALDSAGNPIPWEGVVSVNFQLAG